jgi:hypothetical protein
LAVDLSGKFLALLKEAAPNLSSVALWSPVKKADFTLD